MKTGKKKIIALFFTVILIFVLVGQVSGQTKFGPKTEQFLKTFTSDTYHMKSTMSGNGVKADMETYVKGGKTATVMSSKGETTRTVLKDKKTYTILDSLKMIMITAAQNTLSNGAVDTNTLTYTGSGTAVFAGKNLPYEEYTVKTGGKAQFFIDNNKLAGIRNITPGQGTVDLVILALDQNVPDSVFVIPSSGYQVQDMSGF
ncbi:hypothetical protein [Treponema sp. R6D11]